ncbi:MAG: HEPN domain-containing protein [Bacteroidales bacterium]|nr:HEPN domain-containing protein [Bacteroidales bacterium]
MTKEEHIHYWIKSAETNKETMYYLFQGNKYVDSLFFGHLYLEKICKALWVKNNENNFPPKMHNLLFILEKAGIKLDENDSEFLDILNRYQLEGRYPDYINLIHKETDLDSCLQYINKINNIAQWLMRML